jgi:hypothetical protein
MSDTVGYCHLVTLFWLNMVLEYRRRVHNSYADISVIEAFFVRTYPNPDDLFNLVINYTFKMIEDSTQDIESGAYDINPLIWPGVHSRVEYMKARRFINSLNKPPRLRRPTERVSLGKRKKAI